MCSMKQTKRKTERVLNKKMLERLIIIHNAIKANLYPDNRRLRKLYCEQTGYGNVGEATINRDIDTLRTFFHAPLEFDRQKGGYFYSDDKFEFALNNISSDDVFYLSAAKTLLSSFSGSPLYKSISDVIDFVADTQGIGKSSLLDRIAVPPRPAFSSDEKTWKAVMRSIREDVVLEFDYSGRWHTETSHRRVAPYQILMDEGRCFLFALDFGKDAVRLFALDRMENVSVTDEKFSLPDDFEFSSRCGGGKFGAFMGEDPVDFVVDFYGDARQFVKECVWADNQVVTDFDGEGKTRIEFSSTQEMKVMEWILARGENAVPGAPDWFVEGWRGKVRRMAEMAG